MKNRVWGTAIRALALGFVFASSLAVHAEDAAPEPNKVKTLTKEAGKPVRVLFNDGSEIGFKIREVFTPFQTTATLSDNSCTRDIGTKAHYVAPVMVRAIVPYWTVHATKQGQSVQILDKQDDGTMKLKVDSQPAFYSRVTDKNFSAKLALPNLEIANPEIVQTTLANPNEIGWFECLTDCPGLMPKTDKILIWDENFEADNDQMSMIQGTNSAPINEITNRMQEVPVRLDGRRIFYGPSGRTFGFFGKFLPPGITYQFQWNIRAPNIVDTGDTVCQIKWDLDFSQIFTQFTKLSSLTEDPEKVQITGMREYIFQDEDGSNIFANDIFSESHWSNREILR